MKGKLSSSWRVAIALVMVLGLSLIPAIAQGAGPDPATYAGYKLQGTTATWSTTTPYSGKYSVLLHTAADEVDVAYGQALSTISSVTGTEDSAYLTNVAAWLKSANTNPVFPRLRIDRDGDGKTDLMLAGENFLEARFAAPSDWTQCHPRDAWDAYVKDLSTGTWGWAEPGEPDTNDHPLSYWLSANTTLPDFEDSDKVISIDAEVTAPDVYVDDFTIAGTIYTVEPMLLDAAWYKPGDTVTMTVLNGKANADPIRIDKILAVPVTSTSDTVGITVDLTETAINSGVFVGTFSTTGATPPPVDKLYVKNGDTITASYNGNWGAGSQTVVATAKVDAAAPVITIVSPAASDNISNAKPLIKANYSDGSGSGIKTASVVIKVDSVDKTSLATVAADSVTYTPSANLTEGSHTVTVDVSDLLGNAATQKSWSFTVDTLAPVITGQAANPIVILPSTNTKVTFTATVNDATTGVKAVTIGLSSIGGSPALAMLDNGVAPDVTAGDHIYTGSANITCATEDNYLLTVTGKDYVDNTATATVSLGIWSDIVKPVITSPAITYPYGLTSARPGDSVTISANATDDVKMSTDANAVTAACSAFSATLNLLDDGVAPDVKSGDHIYTGTATVKSDAAKGDYTITITAKDAKGNTATDKSLTLTVVSGATGCNIQLVKGWNLISLPLIPDSANITTIISATNLASRNVSHIGIIRAYDPATGTFPRYIPGTGGDLTQMRDGYGYWVFMNEDDTLSVTGREWPTPPEVPPTYDVVVGWNLIGFKSLVPMIDYDGQTDSGYLLNIKGTYPVLWSYDAEAGAYSNVKGVALGMKVGHGFWIWITKAGTIVPPG